MPSKTSALQSAHASLAGNEPKDDPTTAYFSTGSEGAASIAFASASNSGAGAA